MKQFWKLLSVERSVLLNKRPKDLKLNLWSYLKRPSGNETVLETSISGEVSFIK